MNILVAVLQIVWSVGVIDVDSQAKSPNELAEKLGKIYNSAQKFVMLSYSRI